MPVISLNCPNCGVSLRPTSQFFDCPQCGSPLEVPRGGEAGELESKRSWIVYLKGRLADLDREYVRLRENVVEGEAALKSAQAPVWPPDRNLWFLKWFGYLLVALVPAFILFFVADLHAGRGYTLGDPLGYAKDFALSLVLRWCVVPIVIPAALLFVALFRRGEQERQAEFQRRIDSRKQRIERVQFLNKAVHIELAKCLAQMERHHAKLSQLQKDVDDWVMSG